MKVLISITASAFMLCAAYVIGVHMTPLSQPVVVYAQEAEQEDDSGASEDSENEASESEEAPYAYVAQPGDSYTKMARKAVQTYGIIEEVNLSGAQIVYAETQLTQAVGSPLLDIGEEVEIARSDVSTWVERAQELTEAEESAWNVYVPSVDFNTDSVGEAQE